MKPEVITKQGKPFVMLPLRQYEALIEDQEMLQDIKDYRAAKEKALKEEFFPFALIERILDGENRILVYREYRKLTQQKLADKVGVRRSYIAEIETGRKQGSIKVMKAIAKALKVDLDDIVK